MDQMYIMVSRENKDDHVVCLHISKKHTIWKDMIIRHFF